MAYIGGSVERWKVRAGEKMMYFENNRLALQAINSNQVPKWKLIKGNEYIKDPLKWVLMVTDM